MKKVIICLLSCTLITIASYGQPGIISTIAGDSVFGYTGDGGPATAAAIDGPDGLFVDKYANVFIADLNNNRVREVNTNGIIFTIAGTGKTGFSGDGGPATAAELYYPNGVTMDISGNIYIADDYNNRIRKINTNGIISTIAGTGYNGGTIGSGAYSGDGGPATAAELFSPFDLFFDKSGNLFFSDFGNARVRMINTNGIISTVAGNGTYGYNGDGISATAAELHDPAGIAMDSNGNLYFADKENQRVREVNTNGIISTIAGTGTAGFSGDSGVSTSAELSYPIYVAVDPVGNIYVSDYGNSRIRQINGTGIISTIAGTGKGGYNGDGIPATSAELYYPYSIVVDRFSNIYIGDNFNSRVRKIGGTPLSAVELTQTNLIKVYPNPSNGLFTFESSGTSTNTKIEIYNMFGENIRTESFPKALNEKQVDLSGQPAGIYLYRIVSEQGVAIATGKLVIE